MSAVPTDFDYNELSKKNSEHVKNIDFKGLSINESPVEKPRRCTDVLCCILFLVVFVGMMGASIYGYVAGAPWKLLAPVDGDLNICGYSPGYEDYQKLYIGDIEEAAKPSSALTFEIFSYGVCVKECPTELGDPIDCKITEKV